MRIIDTNEDWPVERLEEAFSSQVVEVVSTESDVILCTVEQIKEKNWKLKGRPIVRSNKGIAVYKDCNKMGIIRVLDTLLEDIHSNRITVGNSTTYTLHIGYFAEKYNYIDKLYAYSIAKEAILDLNNQIAAYKDGIDDTIYLSRLVDTVGFNDKNFTLTVKFTETGHNLLVSRSHHKGSFMRLSDRTSLTESTVKYKLMVSLQQNSYRKTWKVPLPKLRQLIEAETKYTTWQDLKVCVVEPALKELEENVGLKVSYLTERLGRSIYSLEFTYDIR